MKIEIRIQQFLLISIIVAIASAQSKQEEDCKGKLIFFNLFCQIGKTNSLLNQNEKEVTSKPTREENVPIHYSKLQVGENQVKACTGDQESTLATFTLSSFHYSPPDISFELHFNLTLSKNFKSMTIIANNYESDLVRKTIDECLISNCFNSTFQLPKYAGFKTTCHQARCITIQLSPEETQELRDVAESLRTNEIIKTTELQKTNKGLNRCSTQVVKNSSLQTPKDDETINKSLERVHANKLRVGRNRFEKCFEDQGCYNYTLTLTHYKFSPSYFQLNFSSTIRPVLTAANSAASEENNFFMKTIEECLTNSNCLTFTFQVPHFIGFKTTCYLTGGCSALKLTYQETMELLEVTKTLRMNRITRSNRIIMN
jgi:hypothetical protein